MHAPRRLDAREGLYDGTQQEDERGRDGERHVDDDVEPDAALLGERQVVRVAAADLQRVARPLAQPEGGAW